MVQRKVDNGRWIRRSFMSSRARTAADLASDRNRHFTNVRMKFTDTTLGGNFPINPPPQFTRFADIKARGMLSASKGMGRYYSESIDDHSQIIHIRAGVPKFNNLTTFFTGFYDPRASALARTGSEHNGWLDRILNTLGRAVGVVLSIPLIPLIATGRIYRFLSQQPASKYYYLEPAMPMYWQAVGTIANDIAVTMGLIPRVGVSGDMDENGKDEQGRAILDAGTVDSEGTTPGYREEVRRWSKMMPSDIFRPNGGVDIYAVATRAQRMANVYHDNLRAALEDTDNRQQLRERIRDFIETQAIDTEEAEPEFSSTEEYLRAYIEQEPVKESDQHGGTGRKQLEDMETNEDGEYSGWDPRGWWHAVTGGDDEEGEIEALDASDFDEKENSGWIGKLAEFSRAEFRDGGQWITFRVDHVGEVSESFSNSTQESDIAQKINQKSSQMRTARFNFSEGNTGVPIFDSVMKSAGSFLSGILDGVQASGLGALAGSAFVDIPEYWDSSSLQLPTTQYTIHLRSPYGNPISRYMNLYVPLAMLLALALPLSTGKRSYTSPFLVELYSKGRAQVRLGIVESLSITRGTGNLGWTVDEEPLGIDVQMTIKDLSTVMHMPISTAGSILNPFSGIFDEDSTFNDYLSTLGSLSLSDQVYALRRLRLNITRKTSQFDQWFSVGRFASVLNNTPPGRVLSAIAREGSRDGGGTGPL